MKKLLVKILFLIFGGGVVLAAPIVPIEQSYQRSFEVPVYDVSPDTPGDFPIGYYSNQSGNGLTRYAIRTNDGYEVVREKPDLPEAIEIGKAYIDRCTDGITFENKKITKADFENRKRGIKPDCKTFKSLIYSTLASAQPTLLAGTLSGDQAPGNTSSDSISYDSGSTGSNRKLYYVFGSPSGGQPSSATYNSESLTVQTYTVGQYHVAHGYLDDPATGSNTFAISYPSQTQPIYRLFVLENAGEHDTQNNANNGSGTSETAAITVAEDDSYIVAWIVTGGAGTVHTPANGNSPSALWSTTQPYGVGNPRWSGSEDTASAGSFTAGFTWTGSVSHEMAVFSVKYLAGGGGATNKGEVMIMGTDF